jgi:multiple sugar transport system permease protein
MATRNEADDGLIHGGFQQVGMRVGFYGSILLLVLISLFPVIWMLITSLKQPNNVIDFPVNYIPKNPTLQNYVVALEEARFLRFLFNSAIVATGTAVLDVFLGALAGYSLSRLEFRFKLPVLMLILGTATLPFFSRLIPLFKLAREFGMLNSYLGLIIPYAAFQLPLAVWIFQAYFKELPDSLEEAALMDGLSRIGVLFRIILPVSMPAMATTFIIVFIFAWNEFLFALTFMTNDSMKTITVGIAQFGGQFQTPWGTIAAGVIMSILPLMAFMLFFQRKVVEGLTAGTGKA